MVHQNQSGLINVHSLLHSYNLRYWLDSGTLLGMVRSKGEIEWDSDIDLAIWDEDIPKTMTMLKSLQKLGYKTSSRAYKGRIYGMTIIDIDKQLFKPVHIHVYFRNENKGIAWSPQTVTIYSSRSQLISAVTSFFKRKLSLQLTPDRFPFLSIFFGMIALGFWYF